jgi:isopentenyl-diphosphate delta-isomerase
MSRAISLRETTEQNPAAVPDKNGTAPNTVARKGDHIRINLEENVAAKGVESGFDQYHFLHRALPEIDLADVECGTDLLGKALRAPILISCMTGGTPEAGRINATLAEAANELGIAMGLGSGRVLLEHPEVLPSFQVRARAPKVPILANLGAVQLNKGVTPDDCKRLLDMLEADILVLHLNPLQEALQAEGDTCFGNLLPRIGELCRQLDHPVIVKEVGWGLAPDVVRALLEAGVAGVDVAGAGGTSWSEVERHRLDEPWRQRVAEAFAGWGLPTAEALRQARQTAGDALVIASGGLRDGVDLAKAVALGANLGGLAGTFLRAAAQGMDAAVELGRELVTTLRVTMFCVGARSLDQLRRTPRLLHDGVPHPHPQLHSETLRYATPGAGRFLDITPDVQTAVSRSGLRQGHAQIFAKHTTAAIRINENEPLLMADFRQFLERLVPPGGYDHDDMSRRVGVPADEPVNGHSHCRHLLLSSSETIPISDGRLALGVYQRLFLIELCSPRNREVNVQIMGWR